MRLIDADELLKALNTQDAFGYSCNDLFRLSKGQEKDYIPYICFDDVVNCINNMSTAYKIDKVVKELQAMSFKAEKTDEGGWKEECRVVKLKTAIDIVEAGGKE